MAYNSLSERGFTLVVALWLLIVISLICSGILLVTRDAGRRSASNLEAMSAQLLADAAINVTIFQLSGADASDILNLQPDYRTSKILGQEVSVEYESESGKLSLNDASISQLSSVFIGEGLPQSKAFTLAEHIVKWRSHLASEDRVREVAEYAAVGRRYVPRFDQFHSVGELRLVLGMTDELAASAELLFTVWSRTTTIDRSVASFKLLGDLAASGDSLASSELAARGSVNTRPVARRGAIGEVFTIHTRASFRDASAQRKAVVQLSGDKTDPVHVLEWK